MAGTLAIAVVAEGANGEGAAVSGEGDAGSGLIENGFSIDVSAELLPTGRFRATGDRQCAGGCDVESIDGERHRLLRRIAGCIGRDDGEGVGGLCFVVRISEEGDFPRGAVDGKGGSVVVVVGFKAVAKGGVIGCDGCIDDLVCTAVFINRSCSTT